MPILKYQLFSDATVELSLDSTQNNQKMMPAKTLSSHSPQEATNSPKPQPSYEEVRICTAGLLTFVFRTVCSWSGVHLALNLRKHLQLLKKTYG